MRLRLDLLSCELDTRLCDHETLCRAASGGPEEDSVFFSRVPPNCCQPCDPDSFPTFTVVHSSHLQAAKRQGGPRATMRRAAVLCARGAPSLWAALEVQPSTSSAVQLGRAFTTAAAARAPVHPEEEVYNRCVGAWTLWQRQ